VQIAKICLPELAGIFLAFVGSGDGGAAKGTMQTGVGEYNTGFG